MYTHTARPRRLWLKAIVLSVIAFLVVAGAVLALAVPGGPLTQRYLRGNDGAASSVAQEQRVTSDGITITLVSAVASPSQTLAELILEDPLIIPQSALALSIVLPFWEDSIRLSGFSEPVVRMLESRWYMEGAVRILLDLPPLADPTQPGTVEIHNVKRLDVRENRYVTHPGPWVFTVPPPPVQQWAEVRIPLDMEQTIEGLSFRLLRAQLTPTETLVYYEAHAPPGHILSRVGSMEGRPTIQDIGGPKLRYGELAEPGRTGVEKEPLAADGSFRVVSFPAVPRDVGTFRVTFGPFLKARQVDGKVVVPLPANRRPGEAIPLDYAFSVGGLRYRATALTDEGSSFKLSLRPDDDDPRRGSIFGSVDTPVYGSDDAGNDYGKAAGDILWDSRRVVEKEVLTFHEPLAPEATELVLQIDEVQDPIDRFEFTVPVPPPPPWVNPDGTVGLSKMPNKLPLLDRNGNIVGEVEIDKGSFGSSEGPVLPGPVSGAQPEPYRWDP
ncbi:MAG: hypothetical protein HYY01_05375 [Chloroflexi bacterium]|nr:hypothetical protein [Chloroflexota bacterium]